eukprot:535241-Hanusia_phi.AAC.6
MGISATAASSRESILATVQLSEAQTRKWDWNEQVPAALPILGCVRNMISLAVKHHPTRVLNIITPPPLYQSSVGWYPPRLVPRQSS